MGERRVWEERSLVVLGIVLHALYMLSIFDIYFKSPIVHGMQPVAPRFHAPAKRLILFVADGMRADKFFETDNTDNYRAPFLRDIIQKKGRWGVSHARPPTESRPGHVAIIAGFYEDPSAVTKGWKANPVEFDSVFNRSRYTVAFGSPDIVPMFCGSLNNSHWKSYPHEYEDFATDASFLDEWSFSQFGEFLNRSKTDPILKKKLEEDKLVIFLHLLGCDTNGHAHRPYSPIYLNNIKVVDRGVEEVFRLMEEHFPDNRTAYVFTADHGMSDKGSHGDGHPTNTETPLVVWGAGIRKPSPATPKHSIDGGFDGGSQFVDQHVDNLPTPAKWGLGDIERVDVNQGDIAPLMSTLLGLPCPMNSVGTLPMSYLDMSQKDQAEALFANSKEILNQFLRKSELKHQTSIFFKPFKPISSHNTYLQNIETLIYRQQYEAALQSAKELISMSLAGLQYFQTYDWLALMTTIILGYLGWMVYLLLYVMRSYTAVFLSQNGRGIRTHHNEPKKKVVRIIGACFMMICSAVLIIDHAPLLYHFYIALAVFFWTEIFSDVRVLRALCNVVETAKLTLIIKVFLSCVLSIFILELLVMSFFKREVYTGVFLAAGVVGAVTVSCNFVGISMVPAFVWAACWFLSSFTLMPAQIPDNTICVVLSGLLVVIIALLARWFDSRLPSEQAWRSILSGPAKRADKSFRIFLVQILLVLFSTGMVWISTSNRSQKKGLPVMIQLTNWFLAGVAVILPLFSPRGILTRLSSVFLGFAPPFMLLSIGYEALFYNSLALVLVAWILVESAIHFSPVLIGRSGYSQSLPTSDDTSSKEFRSFHLSDIRVPLCFIVLINVAFFGTGNVASVASFEISSVYRFITIFSPFLMAGLLLFKIFIPFILVTCAFSAITKLLRLPRLGCYFVVIILSDVMTIHFFFLVRTTGSWMEIGQSISHFGIMSALVVFVLVLFGITNIYTKDIHATTQQQGLNKIV